MPIVQIAIDGLLLALCLEVLNRFERPPLPKKFRKMRRPKFRVSLSVFGTMFAIFLAIGGRPSRALLCCAYLMLLIGLASRAKSTRTPFNLVAGDVSALWGGAAEFLSSEYRGLVAWALGIFAALTAVLIVGLIELPHDTVPWFLRFPPVVIMPVVLIGVFQTFDWRDWFAIFAYTKNYNHISGFFVSILIEQNPDRTLRLSDVASEGIDLPTPRTDMVTLDPDVIIIHHESTFDPRIYGIKIGRQARQLMYPPGSVSGRLRIDTFGGNSWMTEFSLMTGISSRALGANSQYIFHKAEGRIRHALPLLLKARGYATSIMATVSARFLKYDDFYRSIGVEQRIFMADQGPPFDEHDLRKHHSDEKFYDRALDQFAEVIAKGARRQMLVILTNFNHGPHDVRRLSSQLSKNGRERALEEFADEEYGEYYARMMFSAKAYARFREELAAKYPERKILVIRYGDHQPSMVKRILKARGIADDDPRTLETFYSIEGINFTLDHSAKPAAEPLDVAFLGTVAMRAGRMERPPIMLAQEQVMAECGSNYQDTPSVLKGRLHRSMIDMGLIDAEPA